MTYFILYSEQFPQKIPQFTPLPDGNDLAYETSLLKKCLIMRPDLHFLDSRLFNKLPKRECSDYLRMKRNLGIPDGHPFFLGDDLSYDEVLNGFCRHLVAPRRNSPNTWKSYAYTAAEYLDFSDARGIPWLNANNEHLLDYHGIKTRGTDTLAKVGGQTWNHIEVVLRHMYEYAHKQNLIPEVPFSYRFFRSPYRHIENKTSDLREKTTPTPINYISINQYKAHWRAYLMTREHAQRNISLIELLICSGFRISEALGLTIYNIPDPDSTAYAGRNVVPIKVTGKGNKKRTVPIPKRVIRVIQFYIDEDRKVASQKYEKEHGPNSVATQVFLAENGNPLSVRMVEDIFQEASKATGIQLRPHGCRHIYATVMLDALIDMVRLKEQSIDGTVADKYDTLLGDPLVILQKLLGHASVGTVFTYLELPTAFQGIVEDALTNWTSTLT